MFTNLLKNKTNLTDISTCLNNPSLPVWCTSACLHVSLTDGSTLDVLFSIRTRWSCLMTNRHEFMVLVGCSWPIVTHKPLFSGLSVDLKGLSSTHVVIPGLQSWHNKLSLVELNFHTEYRALNIMSCWVRDVLAHVLSCTLSLCHTRFNNEPYSDI